MQRVGGLVGLGHFNQWMEDEGLLFRCIEISFASFSTKILPDAIPYDSIAVHEETTPRRLD